MPPLRLLLPLCLATLAGCAKIPVAEAERQCARAALYGGSDTAFTVGIGTGSGGWGYGASGAGAGIAMTTTLPQRSSDPAASYEACVLRKSGQRPVTPFAERPEIRP